MNQPSRFRRINWVEINDESIGKHDSSSIKLKMSMIRTNLCDYSDLYILVSGAIAITGDRDDDATERADERNKGVIFKNCAPYTNSISNINNTQIDNAECIDVVMRMYNLIEYSDTYSKTSRSLWIFYKDEPNDNITKSESFKSKIKITGKTHDNGNTKHF